MRTQEVEIKVLDVVEAIRRGEKVEDDLVECKLDWPDVSKARQFAGLCNKARGSDVLLIIGLNEKTGSVHPLGSTDPATWWTSFQARFDEAPPNLTVHLRVAVGDGEFVPLSRSIRPGFRFSLKSRWFSATFRDSNPRWHHDPKARRLAWRESRDIYDVITSAR